MSIIWIAGWPHNGSTLLREILQQCWGIVSHSLYAEPELEFLFGAQAAEFGQDWGRDPVTKRFYYEQAPEVHFIKTHELPVDGNPALFVVRDGRDAMTALSRFWKLPIRNLIVGQNCAFGGWSNFIWGWDPWGRPNTLLLRFEKMVRDPMAVAGQVREWLDLPIPRAFTDRYVENQKVHPALYNGRVDIWKDGMRPVDQDLFWKCHGAMMERLGYAK